MPGPCNSKKKKRLQSKRERKGVSSRNSPDGHIDYAPPTTDSAPIDDLPGDVDEHHHDCDDDDDPLLNMPNIYDPGTGPRIRDARGFLSSFFAQPPSLSDPLCAEFSQEEILQMLCTILPEETAIIVWYNKSRATGRVCPCCRRLYNLGDVLPALVQEGCKPALEPRSHRLALEQQISGLCSPLCFILASFDHPEAIKSTWGLLAEEIDEHTWELLNRGGVGRGDRGLSLLLRMTRLPDLGLAQLCLPGVDMDL